MDRLAALKAFVRVVELDSFSAAARELSVGQSTVSRWVAALEDELGVQLLERTTRHQSLTAAGETFYERARNITASFEDAAAELQGGADRVRGLLRVSVPVVFGSRYLLGPIAEFMGEHPDVAVELLSTDRYVNLVEERIDVAIRVGSSIDSTFRARVIAQSARRLVALSSTAGQLSDPEELRGLQCFHHTDIGRGSSWTFRRGDEERTIPVRGRFAANSSEAVLEMVRHGHGVALLAGWLVDDLIASGELVALLPDWTAPDAPIRAVMPPGRHIHPRTRTFIDFIGAALKI